MTLVDIASMAALVPTVDIAAASAAAARVPTVQVSDLIRSLGTIQVGWTVGGILQAIDEREQRRRTQTLIVRSRITKIVDEWERWTSANY